MSIKAFFDGLGKTHVHLVAALVMNVANVILCWMFIFGHAGAPRMGAPGAGLAAFIATLDRPRDHGRLRRARAPRVPPDARSATSRAGSRASILKLSVPAAAATVIMMLGFGLFARTAGQLDASAAVQRGRPSGTAAPSRRSTAPRTRTSSRR